MPTRRSSASVSVQRPATATTGTVGSWAIAARATPTGALPCSVWASSEPSPVITSRASSRRDPNEASSSSSSIPGRRAGPRRAAALGHPGPQPGLGDSDHLALLHAIWTDQITPARDWRYRDLLLSILPPADRREPSH